MTKTIIVPIDLSQPEKADAMIEAAKLLGEGEGSLVLVSIIEDIPGYVAAEMPAGFLEGSAENARKELRAIGRNAGLEAAVEVRKGNAASGILAVADERQAAVIVIASHRPGFQDYFLGSTAARVVRHAKCSVYVIR